MIQLVIQNIKRDARKMLICAFGISLGVGMFAFFLALGQGIQQGVLDRIYPINQVEFEPSAISMLGMKSTVGEEGISAEVIKELESHPEVLAVFPKSKSHFPSRLFGGEELFGEILKTEAYLDGLPVAIGATDATEGLVFDDHGEALSCTSDDECTEEGACFAGRCWALSCDEKDGCGEGLTCVRHRCSADAECSGEGTTCVGGRCSSGVCSATCAAMASLEESGCGAGSYCTPVECEASQDCLEGACEDGFCVRGYCDHMPCSLLRPKQQLSLGEFSSGIVEIEGPAEGISEVKACPEGTFCIPESVDSAGGYCEAPIPALLSPVLLELFDLIAAPALGLEPLGDGSRAMGLIFHVQYGNSYMSTDRHRSQQVTKKAQIVGVSPKAMELGVTVPLPYMQRANYRLGKGAERGRYDTAIVSVRSNGEVQAVLSKGEAMGLQVTARTREGKKAANLLLLVTLSLSFVSWLILVVAAVHVSQTFNMTVTRRTREFGILRSIGARGKDLRKLVFMESVIVGGGGGVAGVLIAWSIGLSIETLLLGQVVEMSVRPEGIFSLSPDIAAIGLVIGIIFSLLGAWRPAIRASTLDPAVITR